ncbi:MAG: UDP-3-O-(3-hydroxymyristoyl)glucosamine N-acyltransferase [Elusimicrobiota bacterium]
MSADISLGELAPIIGCELVGKSAHIVQGAAGLSEAGPTDVSFLENPKYAPQVAASKAGAVILPPEARGIPGGPPNRLYCAYPKQAYAQWLSMIELSRRRHDPPIVSTKADVHREARLGLEVSIGPFAVIGARTLIGDRTRIGANCVIGINVRIGKDCVIHPGAVLYDFCELGDRVIIHSGTVLGSDGYGYWTNPKTGDHLKVPQIGRVVVENDVEIGSNASIDRATTGETRIGSGSKIDNLVQVAHNVRMGANCLLVSQSGIAGSTSLGRQVTIAGQVGIAGHLKIGDGVIVTAQAGVMNDAPPGMVLFGSPARPHREALKIQALIAKLPQLYQAFKEFKKGERSPQEHSDA